MIYKIYRLSSESFCFIHEGEFADDAAALDYVAGLDPSRVYSVEASEATYTRLVTSETAVAATLPFTSAMRSTWVVLPLPVRAAFATVRAAIFVALDDGDNELARYLISQADVPAELEEIRQELLGMIP